MKAAIRKMTDYYDQYDQDSRDRMDSEGPLPELASRPTTASICATRADYSGIGPQGYVRSDRKIWEDVCDFLTRDCEVDASHIHVEVNEGEAYLEGEVRDRQMRLRAEECIREVSGLRRVHNHLQWALMG